MSEYAALKARYLAGVEAHKTHQPRLYRGSDGIYRCPACDPPGVVRTVAAWLDRTMDVIRERRRR